MRPWLSGRLWFAALAASVLAAPLTACDDAGEASTEQRRCDVLFLLQQRVGSRIVSPAPTALHFGAYGIVEGQRVESPSLDPCVTRVAEQLDAACGACLDDPGGCEQLVRTIFATPDASCSACGDGVCLTGETPQSCPEDCASSCGDETCAADENEVQCPFDCAAACGDGFCTSGESPTSCPRDCRYTVGDGLCEPGEGPVNSPQDCQNATCGDGYCQSYETSLLCPEDCCVNPLCNADGPVCTGTHELATCRVLGPGNCPEVIDPLPCALGCEWRPGDEAAGCRTCDSLAGDLGYLLGDGSQPGDRVAAACAPGEASCVAVDVVLDDLSGGTDAPPRWQRHRVVECEPIVAFEMCHLATTVTTCALDEGCDGGTCVSCEQAARDSGLYPDLDTADYVYGCAPGAGVCARVTDTDSAVGLRDVVVDCEPIAGSSCTIGRVVEDCGIYEPDPSYGSCFGGVCGNCLAAARNAGHDVDNEAFVFGCDVAAGPACTTARSTLAPGEDRTYRIDACATIPGRSDCTLAAVVDDCGAVNDPGTSCTPDACAQPSP